MPAKPKDEPTLSLSVEERRRRVDAVRGLDRELEQIENALLDAQARLPSVIAHVARVRQGIAQNTAPLDPDDEDPG